MRRRRRCNGQCVELSRSANRVEDTAPDSAGAFSPPCPLPMMALTPYA
jgi:hypothetical protein